MARIRSIHPSLFTDEQFVNLSDGAQVFYLGLLTEADDQGIFEWKPVSLRLRLRGNRDGGVEGLLSELEAADKVAAYELDGRKYGAIRNFRKFQRPKSPNAVHPTTLQWRIYVGLEKPKPETPPPQPDQFPPNGEKSPQMEDGGGRRESGAKAPTPPAPPAKPRDVTAIVFDDGLKWLHERTGKPDTTCRSLLGKWRRSLGDAELLATIGRAQREGIIDPVSWFERIILNHERDRPPKGGGFNL